MELIGNMLDKFNIQLHTYCLMSNHYHLLLETIDENISEAIQYLNGTYSMYFNKKYKRTGHFWQGRYLSYYLYDNVHAWIVAKYIEQNPITAKMVRQIEEYPYQSFFQWKNRAKYFKLLENSLIFDMTLEEYERYIYEEMKEEEFLQIYATPKMVTRNGEMRVLYKRLETFFEEDRDINRNANMKKAFVYGYSKVEIARFVGLSAKMVGKILGKRRVGNDRQEKPTNIYIIV
jgi:REP element-mobilizing transposase RayT